MIMKTRHHARVVAMTMMNYRCRSGAATMTTSRVHGDVTKTTTIGGRGDAMTTTMTIDGREGAMTMTTIDPHAAALPACRARVAATKMTTIGGREGAMTTMTIVRAAGVGTKRTTIMILVPGGGNKAATRGR